MDLKKKIVSLVIAFGLAVGACAALPAAVFPDVPSITASAQTSGAWDYELLSDSSVKLTAYHGSDSKLTVPSSIGGKKVTVLGSGLFNKNEKLESVTVPDTVTDIQGSVFSNCSNLKAVSLPAGVKTLGSAEHGYVFLGCKKLESITLPSALTRIEDGLLMQCQSLKSVNIPAGVKYIGSSAFAECTQIKSITIPANVSEIGTGAFLGCTSLESISVNGANKSFSSLDGVLYNKDKTKLICLPCAKTSLTVPPSVYEIDDYAFAHNRSLTTIILPSSVSIIGEGVFTGCTNLRSILVNGANKSFCSQGGLLFTKDLTQLVCCPASSTGSFTLPQSLRTIHKYALSGCRSIKALTLPEKVSLIGANAFENSSLTGIYIGGNNTVIEPQAFANCANLSAVTLSKGVRTVSDSAFINCPKLKSVFVPSSVNKIGSLAFGCKSSANSFFRSPENFVLYCEGADSAAVRYAKETGIKYLLTPQANRLAGTNRYATAAAISKNSFEKAETVVLAYGLNSADALAGVPLAKALGAPILLTNQNELPKETLSEIKRLGAKKVIILGGEGAVSKSVEKLLKDNKLSTERYAGASRFGTAAAIAKKLNKAPSEVFFVYAFNYADALSVSTVAAAKGAPIIYLNTKGELDQATKAYLASIKGKVRNAYVIGGTGVISDEMMKKAAAALALSVGKEVVRVSGKDRYETCNAVNTKFAASLTGEAVCIAKGLDFPDALAGGVFSALKNAPLMLADNKLKDSQIKYLQSKKADSFYIFGGIGAVNEAIVQNACIIKAYADK